MKSWKKALAVSAAMVAPMLGGVAHAQDWHGAYAGVNVGRGWSEGNVDYNPLPTAASFINLKPTTLHTDPRGFIGGIQAGYNFGGGGWLFGIEADLDTSDVKGTREVSPIIQNNGTAFTAGSFLRATVQNEALGSLRLRLGHTINSNMVWYLMGGGAMGRVQYTANTDFRPGGTVFYKSHFTTTASGWTAGAGAEWNLAPNWTMRAEYVRTDLGDESRIADPSPTIPTFHVGYHWSNSQDSVGLGLNYHF